MKASSAIIILNWNSRMDTIECLDSISNLKANFDFFVVLVDNNSKIKIDDLVNKYKYKIYIINNESNFGFAKGNNIGIKFALKFFPKYIILLNNDTVLIDNSLVNLVNCLELHPDYGVLGAVNYYFDTPSKIWQAGSLVNFRTGGIRTITSVSHLKGIIDVDYVPGSSLVVRSHLLQEVNFLNEKYFAYWEENELCYKISGLNYKIGFVTNTKILHKVQKTNRSAIYNYLYIRNKLYFFKDKTTSFSYLFIILNTLSKYLIKSLINTYYGYNNNYKALYYAIKDASRNFMGYGNIDRFK